MIPAGRARRASSGQESGQALVEFVIIVPVLVLFVLLTVDAGRAYFEAIDAAGAARAGARMGIISDTSYTAGELRDEPTPVFRTRSPLGRRGPRPTQGRLRRSAATCGDPSGRARPVHRKSDRLLCNSNLQPSSEVTWGPVSATEAGILTRGGPATHPDQSRHCSPPDARLAPDRGRASQASSIWSRPTAEGLLQRVRATASAEGRESRRWPSLTHRAVGRPRGRRASARIATTPIAAFRDR